MRLEVRHAKAHWGDGVVCLLNGARCHAQGHGDTVEQAHAALVAEARELHAALGPWLAERTTETEESYEHGYLHTVTMRTRDRYVDGLHHIEHVAFLEGEGPERMECIEGKGSTPEEARESLRNGLVKLHAAQWAAFARALKGGE